MGLCSSKSPDMEKRDHGICVIEIIRANHLPNMDITSLTDAYVVLCITGAGGGTKLHDVKLRTLPRPNYLDPTFYSYQAFPFIPNDTDEVSLDVMDQDATSQDDKIGSATITFGELKLHSGEMTLPLVMATGAKSATGQPSVTIRLVSCGNCPSAVIKKEIFVIRHGESKWNDSQSSGNVAGMVRQYDHELTEEGIDQAISFNLRWKEERDSKLTSGDSHTSDSDISTFLSVDAIFASPLTRATQTALLTCEDHPCLLAPCPPGHGLTLLRNIREIKNFGSFDTVGRFMGGDIRDHVEASLRKDIDGDRVSAVMRPVIDPNDAVGPWWTPLEVKESTADVHARFQDVWAYLRYGTSADKIILVGHSHFFRFMCKEFLSVEFKEREPVWTAKLAASKLDSGSCLRVSVQWSDFDNPMTAPVITNARLVFGSQLVDGGTKNSSLKRESEAN